MSAFETVIYEKQGNIGYITLSRPQVLNAYNIQMRDELYQILEAIRDDSEVRVAVLKGAGEKAFCAGADLSEFLTAPSPVAAREARWARDIWGLFLSITKPFIAAVHGFVIGSGVEMALCCDIRLAAANARFCLPEVGLGIIPAAGGTQTLPRVVGKADALDMLLTGRWVDAEEALRMRLVTRVVPANDLLAAAAELAAKIQGYNPDAVSRVKQAVTRGLDLTLAQGLELEARLSGFTAPLL